ncbi:Ig-like domain-containing domain [Flavitalea sp.]|nr:Ig-like domain-containing domain [Flavitalea sp.]
MKKNSFVFFTLICAFVLSGMIGGSGCANVIPPTGGPRDSLPPILLNSNPKDSTTNFKGKKITLSFNEYVQLENIQQNLLVTPVPKITPTVQNKLREVTITLRDTLEPNTTYSLNFGDAIRDINEGNPYKNFTYLFSTGSALDSLTIPGNVIIAESGKIDTTIVVVLHKNFADSALRDRPRYATKVDSKGNFVFRNLPADTYALYAFKDESGGRRYTSPTQLFAFYDTLVSSIDPPENIILYAYLEKDTARPTIRRPTAQPKPALKGNAAIADRLLRVQTNLTGSQLGLLPSDTFHLLFPLDSLRQFDSSKVILANEKFEPLNNYRFLRDTSGKRIAIFYPWTENTAYNLVLDKEFAVDSSGRKLPRTDTISFRTKKETDYGLVRMRFPNLDPARNPVLQFVQNDAVVYTYVFGNNREFNSRLFNPGEYELRILYDENKNGKWDPGSFFINRRQPEKVVPVQRKVNIRANIDNDIEITL